MKVYILTDKDFEDLFSAIDRDPKHGTQGGSSDVLSHEEAQAFDKAHRFYNYQVRTWAERQKRSEK